MFLKEEIRAFRTKYNLLFNMVAVYVLLKFTFEQDSHFIRNDQILSGLNSVGIGTLRIAFETSPQQSRSFC